MPSDASGVYSLPPGYLGTSGQVIQPSQHNPPLEDIAAALTARLLRSGASPMTGPLQLVDGSSGAPALTFATAANLGLYKTAAGNMAAVGMIGVTPIGSVLDYAGAAAPTGWLLCFGQSVLRADYPDLFDAISTTYGSVDSTHFTLPNLRGRNTVGKLDMGGSSDTSIDTTTYGADPTVLGAAGGVKNTTVSQANLPNLTLPNTLAINDTRVWNVSNANAFYINGNSGFNTGSGPQPITSVNNPTVVVTGGSATITGSVTTGGSGTAISRIAPGLVLNKIIFAGV